MRHRKYFYVIAIIALFACLFSKKQILLAQERESLTEALVLELAKENNPILAAEAERVNQAQARYLGSKSAQKPQLAASLTYQQLGEEPRYPVIPTGGEAIAGFEKTYRAALSLDYLLYSSGAVENSVRSQKLALEGAKAQETRVSQTVESNVLASYYNLQRARAKLAVAEDVLDLTKEHLKQVESFYHHGVVAKNEVLRIRVDVSEAELNRIKAANGVDVAWSALERAVGVSLHSQYALPDPDQSRPDVPIIEDPFTLALEIRRELQALDHAVQASLSLSKAAAAQSKPQVILQAESYVADNTFFPSEKDDWKISLTALWRFYDGGASQAKGQEAKATANEFLFRTEDLKKQINLEVSVAKLNRESASQRISVAADQVQSAEEDYRMALKRYSSQVGTNIDVLDARVALTNARTQLVDAIYDTHISKTELLYAVGLPLSTAEE